MVSSTLRRKTTVTDAADFEKRQAALMTRLLPLLQRQQGFVSHDMKRDGDAGAMIEVTQWESDDDVRRYLREGGAAMAATILDAFFPTAPYPDGTWVRSQS